VLAAIESERPIATIADFLAIVDWSTVDGDPRPDVTSLLGRLHELTTAVDEGDIERSAFLDAARALARNPAAARGA
jgi:hypothetical protein